MMMLWVVESVGCKADREGRTAKGGRKGVGTNEGTETCSCCCYRRSRSDDRRSLRDCRAMPGGVVAEIQDQSRHEKKRDTMLSHCKSKGKSRGTVPPTVRSFQTTRREQEREREKTRSNKSRRSNEPKDDSFLHPPIHSIQSRREWNAPHDGQTTGPQRSESSRMTPNIYPQRQCCCCCCCCRQGCGCGLAHSCCCVYIQTQTHTQQ